MVVNGFLLNSVSSLTTILADELLLKISFCIFFDSKGKLFFFLTKKKCKLIGNVILSNGVMFIKSKFIALQAINIQAGCRNEILNINAIFLF